MAKVLFIAILACLIGSSPGLAQVPSEILDVSFEEIPAGVVLQSNPIGLQGDSNVAGRLSVTTGVQFGDGSVQTTAATATPGAAEGASANQGLYDNRIPDFTPPNAYTEVCIKSGSLMADVHVISESPAGGNCEPGDLGWLVERDERLAATWARARLSCLLDGMRLPEPFEWQLSCEEAVLLGLVGMTDNNEWASNNASPQAFNNISGTGVSTLGGGGCDGGSWGWVGVGDGSGAAEVPFRCVK